jgi:electron transfer flavoprotein alpha subunit
LNRTIYVIAEHEHGKVNRITWEMFAFAKEMGDKKALPIKFVILGDDINDMAEEIAGETGKNVHAIHISNLNYYSRELYITALEAFFCGLEPAFICVGHSSRGTDFAPGLGVRLKVGNITAVLGFSQDDGRLTFVRPIHNGRRLAYVSPVTDTVILNIQPGIYNPLKYSPPSPGSILQQTMEFMPESTWFTGLKPTGADTRGLTESEVIVAVGNGIGEGEELNLIYRFADIFNKSAVAGSRIVCDRGLLVHGQQVGITGATVSPALYIACGISGSFQHISGMSGSEFVVAINTEADAPIMKAADVCVQEDMTGFIPMVIDVFNQSLSNVKEK